MIIFLYLNLRAKNYDENKSWGQNLPSPEGEMDLEI
jgi:hypothetical protein